MLYIIALNLTYIFISFSSYLVLFLFFTHIQNTGLFEKHKMIFLAQLTFKLMQRGSIQCGDEPGLDQGK